ncbi:MAG: AAA family ATPase, partial [Patescibacteria group bacterium]
RQTALTFTMPVTAIVGPNGSGKSNIAEAVRFVLGEQSIKSLRGKRGEDLIFNGTHSAPRQSKASVTIVFDNSKRNLNIDYDEVRITRVVHRDSTSEYLLNGSRVRLKDILEMLSAFHIGASSHHIISQGEADRILLASPKDRRNMIEDALGLKIYHYKKTESERKLQKTNENLSQVKALKKEIEPHLRFLEKQAEKIKQAEQLRHELKELYAAYFAREKQYLDAEKKGLEAEQRGPGEELERVQKSMEAIKTKEEVSSEEKQAGAMLVSVEQSLEQTRHKREEFSRALGKIEGVIEYEERKLAEEDKKSAVSEEITISKDALINLRDSFIAFTDRVLREEDIPTVHAMIEEMRDKIESFCDTLIEKNIGGAVVVALKNSLSKKRIEQKNIEQEVTLFETEEKTLNDRRIELKRLV